ncbi:hypothetical protein O0L34_g16918 [Tuta absoluta]|nr:hypothetical protein O0L34_g16918 [Tuta absoluta]
MLARQTFLFVTLFKIIVAVGMSGIKEEADLKTIKEFIAKGMEAIMHGVKATDGAAGGGIRRSGNEQASSATPAGGKTCCTPGGCMPCPLPAVPLQFYPVPAQPPMPYVVPMRTVFEPVEHDHPPLHKIREMFRKGKKRWSHVSSSSTSSSESDDSSSHTSRDFEYYDNFPIRVKGT